MVHLTYSGNVTVLFALSPVPRLVNRSSSTKVNYSGPAKLDLLHVHGI